MGYDLHITRAETWFENEGHETQWSEWHALIEDDPELRLAGYNGPHFALWSGHSEDDEAWLDWSVGNTFTKNPDEHLLAKMLQIADRLGANLQGDDGEPYTEPRLSAHEPKASVFSNGPPNLFRAVALGVR